MDAAGGVLLVGGSVLTHATPDKWLEATMGSVMGEWQKRQITYASHKGVARAVALGRVSTERRPRVHRPARQTLRLRDERVLRVVREAFAMRAGRATIDAVRNFGPEHGPVAATSRSGACCCRRCMSARSASACTRTSTPASTRSSSATSGTACRR